MPRGKPTVDDEVHDLMQFSAQAECQKYDPRMWDVVSDSSLTFANRRAIEVCLNCPVMLRCLEHAVAYGCEGSIYGSLTDAERAEWDLANQIQEAVAR